MSATMNVFVTNYLQSLNQEIKETIINDLLEKCLLQELSYTHNSEGDNWILSGRWAKVLNNKKMSQW